jgi:hypothetical protein
MSKFQVVSLKGQILEDFRYKNLYFTDEQKSLKGREDHGNLYGNQADNQLPG